jgi:hypothetical protein
MRLVEILVAVNALCGIAAFLLARGAWRKAARTLGIQDEKSKQKELEQ